MNQYIKFSRTKSSDSFESFFDIISEKEKEENEIQFYNKEHLFLEKEKLIKWNEDEKPFKKFLFSFDFFPSKEKEKDFLGKEITTKSIINFCTNNQNKLRKKRGRSRTKNFNKSVHGSKDFDNLQRKIKVHFLSFLINFCNDALLTEYGPSFCTFKQIKYQIKNTVNFKETDKMKHNSIKDMIVLPISPKFSTYNDSENKEILSKIKNSWLDKLFQMKCLELFKMYYNNEEPLDKIVFENKEITLSIKTKSFYYLLEKYKYLRQNIIDTAKSVYLNDIYKYGNKFSIINETIQEKREA